MATRQALLPAHLRKSASGKTRPVLRRHCGDGACGSHIFVAFGARGRLGPRSGANLDNGREHRLILAAPSMRHVDP
jgi:hypothetical protein